MLNHFNFYLTDKSTEKTFSVFSLTNLIVFCKYEKQQNVMPTAHFKNSWKRGKLNKTEKVTSNTVLEGSTISSLTGNRRGYQDLV